MSPNLSFTDTSSLPPESWSTPEIVEDVVVADDVAIHRAGISTIAPDGEEVCGSAADRSGPAIARARFELLERVATLEVARAPSASYRVLRENGDVLQMMEGREVFPTSDAPERWKYSRSNGIALHSTWEVACRRALWELAERDRILRSWHGEILPQRLEVTNLPSTPSYDWRAYTFPEPSLTGHSPNHESFSREIEVVGVFGFPEKDNCPFVLGLGARPLMTDALEAAVAEALQMLAFLWGEPVTAAEPELQPTAMFHLDTFQVPGRHRRVRNWLEGGHASYASDEPQAGLRRGSSGQVGFVDLTPAWLQNGFRVAKAVCNEAIPLIFGDSPFSRHLPSELRVHPIP